MARDSDAEFPLAPPHASPLEQALQPSLAAQLEQALESQARTRTLSLRQLRATNDVTTLAEKALAQLSDAHKNAQSAADGVLQAVEGELRRYVDASRSDDDDDESGEDDAAPAHARVEANGAVPVVARLTTVLRLVDQLGGAAREANAARDAALGRASRVQQDNRRLELQLAEISTDHGRAEAEIAQLRARLCVMVARSEPGSPAGGAQHAAGVGTPRRLDAELARASFSGAAPSMPRPSFSGARVSVSGAAPPNALAELLVARDMLQAELADREAALDAAHRALRDAQATAAAAARADAEAALEQANRQVRSLANAVKRAVAGQEAAQEEQRLATTRAKAAAEDAAAARAEAALSRATVAKLTRALGAAAAAPAAAAAAAAHSVATASAAAAAAAAAEKPATDALALQQRAGAALLVERATVTRLQRELDMLRTSAARSASREKELEHTLSKSRVAAPADRELRVLVQELARAEATARGQLGDAAEEVRLLHAQVESCRASAGEEARAAADACAAAHERAASAEAVQLRLGAELAAARERIAELSATLGQFALRHDALHRAEATLAQLAAENGAAAATALAQEYAPHLHSAVAAAALAPASPPPPPPPPPPPSAVEPSSGFAARLEAEAVSAPMMFFEVWDEEAEQEEIARHEQAALAASSPPPLLPLTQPTPAAAREATTAGDDARAARVAAAALSESLSALVNSTPARAFAPRRAVPLLAADATADAPFSPAELSSDEDGDDEDEDVGPDSVARSAAALAAAEQDAARLSAHERALRKEEEQAAANSAYTSELTQRARAAVAAADAALGAADADADPKLHRSLAAAKARAEQEAARAEENSRAAADAARAAAGAAATAAEAAAVARATVTAKAFTAARMVSCERRHADFSAKFGAVKAQCDALAKQLRLERGACSRARTEAAALMAVVSASGKADMVADAAARAEALEAALDDEAADFPPPQPLPSGFDERIQHAAAERDRLTDRLASVRSHKQACDALVAHFSSRLEQLKADAAEVGRRAAGGGGLFGRR
jgi:hypothetical protein